MKNIQMVDLKSQYNKIKDQIDTAVIQTIESTSFINGPIVKEFASSLEDYLDVDNRTLLYQSVSAAIGDLLQNNEI